MKNTEIYRVDSHETRKMVFVAACPDGKLDWALQMKLLKAGLHNHQDLQKHFDKYGEDDMLMTIVKKVEPEAIMKEINKCKEFPIKFNEPIPEETKSEPDITVSETEIIEPEVEVRENPTFSSATISRTSTAGNRRKKTHKRK